MSLLGDCRATHVGCNPSCVARRCRRRNCTLSLERLALCLDCDRCAAFFADRPKPDFVILDAARGDSQARWVVVEIKTQLRDITQTVVQLQAGADVIQTDERFRTQPRVLKLVPLVLREQGRMHRADVRRLQARRISFAGSQFPVLIRSCAARLVDIL